MKFLNDIQIREIERKNRNPFLRYACYVTDESRERGAFDVRFEIYETGKLFQPIFETGINNNDDSFFVYRDWYFLSVIGCRNLDEFFALTPPVPEIPLTPEFENQLSFF